MVIKKLRDFGFNTDNRTYIIAEIGINHRGDVNIAKQLIDSAVRSGVDAVKFQTYITEQRAPKGNDEVFKILKDLELPFEAFKELQDYAKQYDVDFFSTPFDKESIEYLESIGTDLYKIASFDIVNHQLLREVAKTGKPVIMSVGMSNLDEIEDAYNILKEGTDSIAILHCISSYPTIEKDSNLSNIYKIQERYDCIIGQSDHTNDIKVPVYAAAAGAQILEKHFKIDDDFECVDAPVSITEIQMKGLVEEVRGLEKIFGDESFGLREAEKGIEIFRRPS
ncbi:MAG: N-acetylneuraminate synthase family protein [Candidatus Brocadiales bacterium]|nr:N-acetylneuraminate synthase family protein [Candidatus Brocadiales bacterium]